MSVENLQISQDLQSKWKEETEKTEEKDKEQRETVSMLHKQISGLEQELAKSEIKFSDLEQEAELKGLFYSKLSCLTFFSDMSPDSVTQFSISNSYISECRFNEVGFLGYLRRTSFDLI